MFQVSLANPEPRGAQAVPLKPQKAQMQPKEFATRKGGKFPLLRDVPCRIRWQEKGREIKKGRKIKMRNNSAFGAQ